MPQNNYPKLHNAMWPGLVGKGSPGAEPFIDLDTMLDLSAKAKVDGVTTAYTVYHMDPEKREHSLSFHYDPRDGGTLRLRGRGFEWRKQD